MRATVSQADVQRAGIQTISVGRVGIGPIKIGQLALSNLDFAMSAGVAHLRNFRVTITLAITLDWRIHISLPDGIPDINEGDTIDVGRPSFTLGLGDVTVPGLDNFSLHIDDLTAPNLTAIIEPLTNLRLGAAVAERVRARNVTLPTGGFTLTGLAIGALRADRIAVPTAGVEQATIGRVHGDGTGFGNVTVPGFSLPAASVRDILSRSVDVSATLAGTRFRMDAGILVLTLTIVPSARAQIDQLEIANVRASTSIARIEMRDLVAPYELLDLTLGQIGIESIDIPSFAAT